MEFNQKWKKYDLIVIGLYVILSLVLTYPVITTITTHIAGDKGDGFQNLWNLWWIKKSILEGKNLYITDYLFYPNKVSLTFHTFSLFNSLFLALPLQAILGLNLIATYNILFLFSFVLAGYGMFLFIRYLTKNAAVAFVAGFAFAFSPYHFSHGLGHLQMMTIGWIPIYMMFFIKGLKEKNGRNPILAGTTLTLVSLSDWYYAVFALVFSAAYIIHFHFSEKPINKDRLARIATGIMIFIITIAPLASPLLVESTKNDYMKPTLQEIVKSVKLEYYVTPNPFNPILGKFAPKNDLSESVVFVGYTIIAIASVFIMKNPKKSVFWLFTALLFIVLSLGPRPFSFVNIPIYEAFYNFFPFFEFIRVSGRFGLMVLISTIILFSYGMKELIKKSKRKTSLLYIVFALVFFEFLSVPYQTTYAVIPSQVYDIAKENGNFTIINIPFNFYNSHAMYLQTAHNKKLVDGYVSRPSEGIINHINRVIMEDKADKRSMTNNYNIKYLIMHKRLVKNAESWVKSNMLLKTYEDENVILFKVL